MSIAWLISLGNAFTLANGIIDFAFLVTWSVLPVALRHRAWWRSRVGTNLFVFLFFLDAIWGISTWHHYDPLDMAFYAVRAVLYAGFAPVGIWRLAEMILAQSWRRPAAPESAPPPLEPAREES